MDCETGIVNLDGVVVPRIIFARRYNYRSMVGSLFTVIAFLVGQTSPASKPVVDRSGEAVLRQMLVELEARKQFHALILRSTRGATDQIYYQDGTIEVWRNGDQLRMDFEEMWGGSLRITRNSKKVMEDTGYDPVILRQSGKSLTQDCPVLEESGNALSPWLILLEGPKLLDRMDKDRSIVKGKGDNSVIWSTKIFGNLTISKEQSKGELETWELQYDNVDYQADMFKQFPDWYDAPSNNARWRQKVILVPTSRFPRGLFVFNPGRGREVTDLTKNVKKPPKI